MTEQEFMEDLKDKKLTEKTTPLGSRIPRDTPVGQVMQLLSNIGPGATLSQAKGVIEAIASWAGLSSSPKTVALSENSTLDDRRGGGGWVDPGAAIRAQATKDLIGKIGGYLESTGETLSSMFKRDSRELGKNMALAGVTRLPGQEAHHIVAVKDERALPARLVLQNPRVGMDINDANNGVFLDAKYHRRLHTDKYYFAVNAGMSGASSYNDAKYRLGAMRAAIQVGTFPF